MKDVDTDDLAPSEETYVTREEEATAFEGKRGCFLKLNVYEAG